MKKALKELIDISRFYGGNKEYTIASGGNTSVKNEKVMYVKASGYELATIDEGGFVALDRQLLQKIKDKKYSEDAVLREAEVKSDLLKSRLHPEQNLRPSVEASVHHAIRYKFVIHLHPTKVNAITCAKNAQKSMQEMFGEEMVFVPYITPGYILYREIEHQNEQYHARVGQYPKIFFLQNHGVFVGANTTQEVEHLYAGIIQKIDGRLQEKLADEVSPVPEICADVLPAIRAALSSPERLKVGSFRSNTLIQAYLQDDDKMNELHAPFTPDGIVFCGKKPLIVTGDTPGEMLESFLDALHQFRKETGYDPKIVVLHNLGIFAVADNIHAAGAALNVFEDHLRIALYAHNFGGPNFMRSEDIAFIESWEVESYRKGLMNQNKAGLTLQNKVAVVTGGAQGFGRGIVEGLLAAGACVQIIDVNEEVAQDTMQELAGQGFSERVIFSKANVTDEVTLRRSLAEVVAAFGGVDLLIPNAGVLRAGPIHELNEQAFDLVTEVNYKGYFLCVKNYVKSMKLQFEANNNLSMDIIQINSKSGLQGSNKNFAYAGSKFGGIGLTQSFALELVPWRIKVNAVCPGNYFEGPLWSDEERGLFAQYLRAGKVPGAKTVADVKKFYESKVPMGRGCTPADVLRAIMYLVGQQYETGQALPVTGGQLMLS